MRNLILASLVLTTGCVSTMDFGLLIVPDEYDRVGYDVFYTYGEEEETVSLFGFSTTSGATAQSETIIYDSAKEDYDWYTFTMNLDSRYGGETTIDCEVEAPNSLAIIWDATADFFDCVAYSDFTIKAEEYGLTF